MSKADLLFVMSEAHPSFKMENGYFPGKVAGAHYYDCNEDGGGWSVFNFVLELTDGTTVTYGDLFAKEDE